MERFRQSQRYAETHGFASGYPDFEQSMDAATGLQFGTILLGRGDVEVRGVLADELGFSGEDVGNRARSAHRYAEAHGFISGFPNWEQSRDSNGNLVYGIVLLGTQISERRIVRATELKFAGDDVGERYRTAHRYAEAHGFRSGFPDWEQSLDDAGELVYGIILIRPSQAERRVITEVALKIFTGFTFDDAIALDERHRLLERHCFAISRISECGGLQPEEKKRLVQAYQKHIRHGISTNPDANAEVPHIGGAQINVNFSNLFPLGDREIAQTLIHEMMHCAGFRHPKRQDTDIPFDGGTYYSSPPLRAELCIAGRQSLTADENPREHCSPINETFVYHKG